MTITALIDGTFANYAAGLGIGPWLRPAPSPTPSKLTLTYGYNDLQDDGAGGYETFINACAEEWDNLDIDVDGARYFPTIINAASKMVSITDDAPTHVTPATTCSQPANHDFAAGASRSITGALGIDAFKRGVRADYICADSDTSGVRAASSPTSTTSPTAAPSPPTWTWMKPKSAPSASPTTSSARSCPIPGIVYDPVMAVDRPMRVSGLFAGMAASLPARGQHAEQASSHPGPGPAHQRSRDADARRQPHLPGHLLR